MLDEVTDVGLLGSQATLGGCVLGTRANGKGPCVHKIIETWSQWIKSCPTLVVGTFF